MSPLYTKTFKIKSKHVDFRRKMRLSVLMTFFQEACIAHTEELGMGRKMTLDRGFLWVILNEHIKINRLPEYDEDVTLQSYPGPTMHFFFPRHFFLKDKQGNVLVEISALWGLIDAKKREMIDPRAKKIIIDGQENGDELPMVNFIKVPPLSKSTTFEATYSRTDINGHLNNAAYVDFALDNFAKEDLEADPKEIKLTFKKEIPYGEKVELNYDKVEGSYYFACPNFNLQISL